MLPPRSVSLVDRARESLPAEVFAYYAAGAGAQQTLAEQEQAWREIGLRPRVLQDVSLVSTEVSLLGDTVASPILIAPTALHGLAHPDGELATARGARKAGCRYVVSMRASRRLSSIAEESGPFWQQVYVLNDRGISDEVARRAAQVGATALVVTVDTPIVARKPAEIPALAWATGLLDVLDGRDPADPRLQQARDLGPPDLRRLHEVSGLPVVAKGVLRGDQALKCRDAGAAAVVVSTHGGRQLDGTITVPAALAEVVRTVGGEVEVYADGGVRTGGDVVRALALGARAVLIGRPVLWALAVGGAAGVHEYLRDFTADLSETLALAGCRSAADVGADLVEGPAS
ncbi:alpha-hydroxy-acid oxidizing protein [Jatrophihabitans telluris]|uniref:Alpha-hydroxy-acid oxidizing protein n=1 Tax=Jatrophihabitans telluris TaxID=2038343 RepID=A0ABY4R124_9ACTN|nr:alpha-hydroxy acid oxidase [Jatrophihabitans telluris]UQX89022.1 alpha-hydroxy-acid oxidizing protein [Jatrophihabitans telluris]